MKKLLLITLLLLAPFCLQAKEFVGITTASTTGDMGGIAGAHNLCQVSFSGSTICAVEDFYTSAKIGETTFTTGVWVDKSLVSEINTNLIVSSSDNCGGWTSENSQIRGPAYRNDRLQSTVCSSSYPLACCK